MARISSSKKLASLIARAAQEKLAERVVIMDMRKASSITDFFIVASADTQRKIKAIADGIRETLETRGEKIHHAEGYPGGSWILLDAGGAVGHIFSEDLRNFYGLERLWGDVPQIIFNGERCPEK